MLRLAPQTCWKHVVTLRGERFDASILLFMIVALPTQAQTQYVWQRVNFLGDYPYTGL